MWNVSLKLMLLPNDQFQRIIWKTFPYTKKYVEFCLFTCHCVQMRLNNVTQIRKLFENGNILVYIILGTCDTWISYSLVCKTFLLFQLKLKYLSSTIKISVENSKINSINLLCFLRFHNVFYCFVPSFFSVAYLNIYGLF